MAVLMSDAICDAIEAADKADRIILPEAWGKRIVAAQEIEQTMLLFADHMKYPLARPDKDGRHAVLITSGLPDLPDTFAYHYARMGWRWHPEKAMIKQRRVVGGLFNDLVAYVGLDEPDDPIIVQPDPTVTETPPPLWSVKPKVNITDEKRPPDA